MNIVNKALLSALALSGAVGNAAATKSSSAYASGLPCSPCTSVDAETSRSPMDDCIVSMKVNFFASETGMVIGDSNADGTHEAWKVNNIASCILLYLLTSNITISMH